MADANGTSPSSTEVKLTSLATPRNSWMRRRRKIAAGHHHPLTGPSQGPVGWPGWWSFPSRRWDAADSGSLSDTTWARVRFFPGLAIRCVENRTASWEAESSVVGVLGK